MLLLSKEVGVRLIYATKGDEQVGQERASALLSGGLGTLPFHIAIGTSQRMHPLITIQARWVRGLDTYQGRLE